ncbi:MAG: hypothetical protein QOE86_2374 [Solirubrobacteraceae bacterium]|jgi:hypothetical protein|nr:hypothetical protein [Solirubrobacteraceae bacterium]
MALPTLIARPLRLTATALDAAAGALHSLAGEPDSSVTAPAPLATREPVPEPAVAPADAAAPRPPTGTRSRVSSPKAARKVRRRRPAS